MKLVAVALGQVIRFVSPTTPPATEKTAYLSDAIAALKQRYKFLQIPITVEEHNFETGVKFSRGWFNRTTIIDKLELYNNGLICEAKHPTEQIDEFVDDLLTWASAEFGLWQLLGPRAYLSNIEFHSDIGFGNKFNFVSEIGTMISAMLQSYGQNPKPFETTQFELHHDTTAIPVPAGAPFRVARRAGKPFAENAYFSSAPLRTQDQLQLLKKLEAILGG